MVDDFCSTLPSSGGGDVRCGYASSPYVNVSLALLSPCCPFFHSSSVCMHTAILYLGTAAVLFVGKFVTSKFYNMCE